MISSDCLAGTGRCGDWSIVAGENGTYWTSLDEVGIPKEHQPHAATF